MRTKKSNWAICGGIKKYWYKMLWREESREVVASNGILVEVLRCLGRDVIDWLMILLKKKFEDKQDTTKDREKRLFYLTRIKDKPKK